MCHVNRAVRWQHQHRHSQTDGGGERRGIRQEGKCIEAGHVVQSVLGDPQVAKPQDLGALRHLVYDRHLDGVRGTMRQADAERNGILQCHTFVSNGRLCPDACVAMWYGPV